MNWNNREKFCNSVKDLPGWVGGVEFSTTHGIGGEWMSK